PINRGNSGGPTFDLYGHVVGVNTAIFSPSGGSVGIGFAIPAAVARDVIADLKDDGSVTRGWLGVMIQPVGEDIAASVGLASAAGAMVTEPQADSPAVSAGISSGDVIVAVNDRKIEGPKELARTIAGFAPGTKVDLTVWRDGAEKHVGVTLGTLPGTMKVAAKTSSPDEPGTESKIGLMLAPAATVGAGEEGVAITEVDPDGPAAGKGINAGDVILDVGGKAVSTPSDVAKGIERTRAAGRKAVLMRVRSGEQTRYVAVPLA
ncbi:MAG: PDZ domain-containing protein, partial [Hyphomicrobiales bacterium]|nr:PDZ domain-containing protein [Hyphomicrobiales bacterium]